MYPSHSGSQVPTVVTAQWCPTWYGQMLLRAAKGGTTEGCGRRISVCSANHWVWNMPSGRSVRASQAQALWSLFFLAFSAPPRAPGMVRFFITGYRVDLRLMSCDEHSEEGWKVISSATTKQQAFSLWRNKQHIGYGDMKLKGKIT